MNFSDAISNWYKTTLRNPKYRWWIIAGSVLYLISPLDISPDFLPVIGWIDDGLIATLLVAEVSQLLTERLKAKPAPAPTAAPAAGTPNPEGSTVDVNAVSM
jgi:uncharacterized membrane protein YkvA (DUF1232 family)